MVTLPSVVYYSLVKPTDTLTVWLTTLYLWRLLTVTVWQIDCNFVLVYCIAQ